MSILIIGGGGREHALAWYDYYFGTLCFSFAHFMVRPDQEACTVTASAARFCSSRKWGYTDTRCFTLQCPSPSASYQHHHILVVVVIVVVVIVVVVLVVITIMTTVISPHELSESLCRQGIKCATVYRQPL